MKMTQELKDQIRAAAENFELDYDVIGIRVQNAPFSLGEISHLSHVWEDGDDTGEELDGICCTSVTMLDAACNYPGEHLAIIGGNNYTYGEDAGEVVIEDAVVLEIIF